MFWKCFGQMPAVEVVSHRIVWSMVVLLGVLVYQQRMGELKTLWKSPQDWGALVITASLLAFNWGLYIYAVNTARVVEASLGYYINPLVNVILGVIFLKEHLRPTQKLAVVLAAVGVVNFVWHLGQLPWIALGLAVSFGFYGLLRKTVAIAPLSGLVMETLLIAPVAALVIGYSAISGNGQLGVKWSTDLLLISSGVMTSFPLLWFNNAAQRLQLSTLGFLQYLAPSLGLMLGVFLYHEPFTPTHAVTFSLIWVAILIYSISNLQRFLPE
jgi:chloramphenicol-sensitive protein RarD